MRQWLYRRDVERRERGYTVPDTVEELAPPEPERGGSAVPHGVRNQSVPTSPVGGFDGGVSATRAKEALTPEFSPHEATDSMATTLEPAASDGSSELEPDALAVSPKKKGRKHSAHASRKYSRSAAKSRGSGRRRHR